MGFSFMMITFGLQRSAKRITHLAICIFSKFKRRKKKNSTLNQGIVGTLAYMKKLWKITA
jgi:hypothetical protein